MTSLMVLIPAQVLRIVVCSMRSAKCASTKMNSEIHLVNAVNAVRMIQEALRSLAVRTMMTRKEMKTRVNQKAF